MPSLPSSAAVEPSPAPTPRSPAQAEASRRNGARSRGPVTVEGKARSSRNALRHGCAGGNFALLACEDRAEFVELAMQLEAGLGAIGEAERPLLGRMLRAEWRARRIERLETLFFERAIEAADAEDADPLALLDSPRLRTLMRYLAAQRSELHRAHDAILRQRQAGERTERHDKAMKDDRAYRGFYYEPAGRWAVRDRDWVPLSAASETAAPAGPPPDPGTACRNEPGRADDEAPPSPDDAGAEAAGPAVRPALRVVPNEPEPAGPDLSPCRPDEPDLPPPLLALWRDPATRWMDPDEVERRFAAAWRAWDADLEASAAWEAERAAAQPTIASASISTS